MSKTTKRILARAFPIPALLLAAAALPQTASAQVSLGTTNGTYTQDFNALINSGATNQAWSNNTTLPGWYLFNSTGAAITAYDPSAGGSNTGKFYSFGAAADTDRALGGVASGGAYFGSPAT